jgi:hypothetical protein
MVVRCLYLAEELDLKLKKEANASNLIQRLLVEHYRRTDYKRMNVDELKKAIGREKAKREYEAKLKEIEEGNNNG